MRKSLIVAAVAAVLGLAASVTMAAGSDVLANRHAQMGVKCEQCHKVKAPKAGAKVKNEQCLACHQSYDALAKRTKGLSPNPHKTHLGNVRCTDCHSGHQAGKLMCNDCHKFNLTVK